MLKSDSTGVRNASNRDQDVTAINVLLTGGCANDKRNLVSRTPTYLQHLGLEENSHAFVAENAPHLLGNVDIFPTHELGTGLDDGHITAEAAISLCQF